jgi:hypothetical protein
MGSTEVYYACKRNYVSTPDIQHGCSTISLVVSDCMSIPPALAAGWLTNFVVA